MKLFIKKISFIVLIFISIIFLLTNIFSVYRKSKGFKNYNTESNTLWMSTKKHYDLLFMGISHARNFSRYNNHSKIEDLLNLKIGNIAQGNGACGLNEQLFYLDYFYHKENDASKIIYILSPSLMFAETLPIASNTFDQEIFDTSFLWRYLNFESENKNARIISYLQNNLHPLYILRNPSKENTMDKELDSLDYELVKKGQNTSFSGSDLNLTQFETSKKIVNKTIELIKKNNSDILLVIPPALFGKWRGHEETLNYAKSAKEKHHNVEILDCSECVLEPRYYYDSHHLNTKGIMHFTEFFFKPKLKIK